MAGSVGYIVFVNGVAKVMEDAGWLDFSGTTGAQLFAVVGKYLDANPEQWNLPGRVLVYRALHAA
ncbi:MAG: Rap1a/Tai family immunity protein [Spirochaetia bacterium]